MRFVLADESRRQLARKRGTNRTESVDSTLHDMADPLARQPEEVLAVHDALDKLGKLRPRYEQLVELRYFAGLSVKEAAEVLAVTPRTVVRDWRAVRVWFQRELEIRG